MTNQIFISYRRTGGDVTAKLICLALKDRGYTVFYDYDALKGGFFDTRILDAIEGCNDVVLVLPPKALDRCVNEDDWVRQEISHALKYEKNIIPVMLDGFEFPKNLPPDIAVISRYNGVRFDMNFYEAVIDKIVEKLSPETVPEEKHQSADVDARFEELRGLVSGQEKLWEALMDLTDCLNRTTEESVYLHYEEIRTLVQQWTDGKKKFERVLNTSKHYNHPEFKESVRRFDLCLSQIEEYKPFLKELESFFTLEKEILALAESPQKMIGAPARAKYKALSPSARKMLGKKVEEVILLCDRHAERKQELTALVQAAGKAFSNLPEGFDGGSFDFLGWAERVRKGAVKTASEDVTRYLESVEKAKQIYGTTADLQLPVADIQGRARLFDRYASTGDACERFRRSCLLYLETANLRDNFRGMQNVPAGDPSFILSYDALMEEYRSLSSVKAEQIPQTLLSSLAVKRRYADLLSDVRKSTAEFAALPDEYRRTYSASALAELYRNGDLRRLRDGAGRVGALLKQSAPFFDRLSAARKNGLYDYTTKNEQRECEALFLAKANAETAHSHAGRADALLSLRKLEEEMQTLLADSTVTQAALVDLKNRIAMQKAEKLIAAVWPEDQMSLLDTAISRLEARSNVRPIIEEAMKAYGEFRALPLDLRKKYDATNVKKEALSALYRSGNVDTIISARKRAVEFASQNAVLHLRLLNLDGALLQEFATASEQKQCAELIDGIPTVRAAAAALEPVFAMSTLHSLEVEVKELLSSLHPTAAECETLLSRIKSPEVADLAELVWDPHLRTDLEALLWRLKSRNTILPLIEEAYAAFDEYTALASEFRQAYPDKKASDSALTQLYRSGAFDTFKVLYANASAFAEKYTPLCNRLRGVIGTEHEKLLADVEKTLFEQMLTNISNVRSAINVYSGSAQLETLASMEKQVQAVLKKREPVSSALTALQSEIWKLHANDLITVVWPEKLLPELNALVEEAKEFKKVNAKVHYLAAKLQPVNFLNYKKLSEINEEFKTVEASAQNYWKKYISAKNNFSDPEVLQFFRDYTVLHELNDTLLECGEVFWAYEYAKSYIPLKRRNVSAANAGSELGKLSKPMSDYEWKKSTICRFDTDGTVQRCFADVEKDLNSLRRVKTKSSAGKWFLFLLFEVLAVGVCVGAARIPLSDWTKMLLWYVLGLAVMILARLCVGRLTAQSGVRLMTWVPIFIYFGGMIFPLQLRETGWALWYLPAVAIGLFALLLVLCRTGFATRHGNGLGVLCFVLILILFIVVWGGKVVTCFQSAEFLEPGFFRNIGNFFIGLWNIIKGLFLGLIQVLMLVIGGGYWKPAFFEGALFGGAILNTLFYSLLAMMTTFFTKGDS